MKGLTDRPPVAAGADLARAAAEAVRRADEAARSAGVSIEIVGDETTAREMTGMLGQVWNQTTGSDPLPPELAWALAHAGNYVALARDSAGRAVAGAVGFRGADDQGAFLHSHIVGVLGPHQGFGVGRAVKEHQRAWALGAGLDRMTWTFDPLVARNAYFNVMKLGACITRYYVDFYGAMGDGINAGDESDRCLATWWLSAPTPAAPVETDDAVEVLSVGADQRPVLHDHPDKNRLWLASLPGDVVAVRQDDPDIALQWRLALRQVLGGALGDSRPVLAVTRSAGYLIGPAAGD
jgi:predicted GNAT superfamily acetyltransferase